ncbi:MAG: helix-turn-helix transcriptional regulator [Bacteroidota bacterium]
MKQLDYDLKVVAVIKNFRKLLRVKQYTVAEALNISVSYYSKIESGKKAMTSGQLKIIGKELGISQFEILTSADGLVLNANPNN